MLRRDLLDDRRRAPDRRDDLCLAPVVELSAALSPDSPARQSLDRRDADRFSARLFRQDVASVQGVPPVSAHRR